MPEEHPPHHAHHHYEPPTGLDPALKWGLIIMGVLGLITLGVVSVVMNKKTAERRAIEAHQAEVDGFFAGIKALDTSIEEQAAQLVKKSEDETALWKDEPIARDVTGLVARARASLETIRQRKELMDQFARVEATLAAAETLKSEQVLEARKQIDDIEANAPLAGDEFAKKVAGARTLFDRVYAQRLLAESQALDSSTPESARLGLVKAVRAEEDVKKILDRHHGKNAELQEFFKPIYIGCIKEADRLVTAVFTAQASEKLPWIDLLSGEQAKRWNASTVTGFGYRVEGGRLQIIGPDADANKQAVLSIGDKEQWRDFILDIEFTMEKGSLEMFFRLGKTLSANVASRYFACDGERSNLDPGQAYQTRISLLGSQFNFRYLGDDVPPPEDEKLEWLMSRKGAVGLLIPPGARVTFNRFRVRELR